MAQKTKERTVQDVLDEMTEEQRNFIEDIKNKKLKRGYPIQNILNQMTEEQLKVTEFIIGNEIAKKSNGS